MNTSPDSFESGGGFRVKHRSGLRFLLLAIVVMSAATPADADPRRITISTPVGGSLVSNNVVEIAGHAPAGSSISVSEGATNLGTATAAADEAWSVTTTLSDGLHEVAADGISGGSPLPTATRNFRIDGTAPAAPVVTEPVAGSLHNPGDIEISGTAEPGSWIDVREGGITIASLYAEPDGTWSTSAAFAAGGHTITVTASDDAAHISAATTRSFSCDLIPASVPAIATPYEGATVNSVVVTGTGDPNATIDISEGGAPIGTATADGTGAWSVALSLADGAHTIEAIATGPGGTSAPASRSFTVDSSLPGAPQFIQPAEGITLGSASVSFTGTADPGAQVLVRENGYLVAARFADTGGGWSFVASFGEGAHTVSAIAVDAAGNLSSATERTFSIDTTPPAAPVILTPADGSLLATHAILISGMAEPAANVTVFEGASLLGSATAGAGGHWSFVRALSDGAHTIMASATDPLGNTGASTTRAFTVDTVGPDAPVILTPAADSAIAERPVLVTGSTEAGAHVVLREGATTVGTSTASEEGSFDTTVALPDGVHTLEVAATDHAGNGGATASVTFTVDTVAPTPPVIESPEEGAGFAGATVTFAGTTELGTTVRLLGTSWYLDAPDSPSWSAQRDFTDAIHTVRVIALDAAGNASQPAVRHIRVDTTAPTVEPTTKNLTVFLPGSTEIYGIAKDNIDVASVSIEVRDLAGGVVTTQDAIVDAPLKKQSTWHAKPHLTVPGLYTVTATVRDLEDNVGHSTLTIAIVHTG